MIYFFKRKRDFSRLFCQLELVDEIDDQIRTVTCHCVCTSYSSHEPLIFLMKIMGFQYHWAAFNFLQRAFFQIFFVAFKDYLC